MITQILHTFPNCSAVQSALSTTFQFSILTILLFIAESIYQTMKFDKILHKHSDFSTIVCISAKNKPTNVQLLRSGCNKRPGVDRKDSGLSAVKTQMSEDGIHHPQAAVFIIIFSCMVETNQKQKNHKSVE